MCYYKIYYPMEFYSILLEYWAQDVTSFDYDEVRLITTKTGLSDLCIRFRKEESQRAIANSKCKLATLIYEMKQRGITLIDGNLYSHATTFTINKEDRTINMPLISMDGIGETTAYNIQEAFKIGPYTTCEEIIERKVNGRKVFTKSVCNKLGIITKEKCAVCPKLTQCLSHKELKKIIKENEPT